MHIKFIDKEKLQQLYIEEKVKLKDVAKIFNCSEGNIRNYLKKYGIHKDDRFRNKQYGWLTVIERGGKYNGDGHVQWLCKCVCGKEVLVKNCHLTSGNTRSCGCKRFIDRRNHPNFKGYKEISGPYWWNIKNGAKARKIELNITLPYIWDLFLQQNRKCALSNIDIYFAETNSQLGTASLDRINSSIGYVIGNVWWVHKNVNTIKWDFTVEELLDWCQKIINNKDKINELQSYLYCGS